MSESALNVSATGYTGVYDAVEHCITVDAPEGAAVTYGTSAEELSAAAVKVKNAGTVIVYWKVESGENSVTGSAVISSSPAPLTITADNKSIYVGGTLPKYTYTVSTGSAKNGTVTVSPKSASKGTTVTITVKPDSGYELDNLTVTDKDGNTIKLTKKNDTQYTFTMPAGTVTVDASFTRIDEQPSITFIDVPTGAYYYDAVARAFKLGITTGASTTTFSPNATCTRGQTVTFLYRDLAE